GLTVPNDSGLMDVVQVILVACVGTTQNNPRPSSRRAAKQRRSAVLMIRSDGMSMGRSAGCGRPSWGHGMRHQVCSRRVRLACFVYPPTSSHRCGPSRVASRHDRAGWQEVAGEGWRGWGAFAGSRAHGSVVHIHGDSIEISTCRWRTLARVDLAVDGKCLCLAGTGLRVAANGIAPGDRVVAVLKQAVADVVAVGGTATHAAIAAVVVLAVVQTDLIARVTIIAVHGQCSRSGDSARRGGYREGQRIGGDLAGQCNIRRHRESRDAATTR